MAYAAPSTDSDGRRNNSDSAVSLMQTAKIMAPAARLALPMPVRQAASVCTQDNSTEESAIARTSRTNASNSAPDTERNRNAATLPG